VSFDVIVMVVVAVAFLPIMVTGHAIALRHDDQPVAVPVPREGTKASFPQSADNAHEGRCAGSRSIFESQP
jgi:hypothetical protein